MRGRPFVGTALATICLIASAHEAQAQPSPVTSRVPSFIRVVGTQTVAGAPDPRGALTITVNDAAGAALAGETVTIDFGNCLETRLCSAQVGAAVLACAAGTRQITGVTNAVGQLTVTILGGGTNPGVVPPPGTDPGAGLGCAAISAGAPPVVLGNATVVLFDENGALPIGGANGVNGLDLSLMLPQLAAAQFGAPYHGRIDFDQNGAINAIDLSFFLALSLYPSAALVGSGAGCATAGAPAPYCPF
jgi:hypothetical protein